MCYFFVTLAIIKGFTRLKPIRSDNFSFILPISLNWGAKNWWKIAPLNAKLKIITPRSDELKDKTFLAPRMGNDETGYSEDAYF